MRNGEDKFTLKARIGGLLCLLVLSALMGACDRTVILRGAVLNIEDKTLPGVAVTVRAHPIGYRLNFAVVLAQWN